MNNEIIKEGDYVIYVGRPDKKLVVYKFESTNDDIFNLYIVLEDSVFMSFNNNGFKFKNDTHQIVKKTTPPKKKVLKEFDVYIDNLPILNNHRGTFSMFNTTDREIKAKLICEVEE